MPRSFGGQKHSPETLRMTRRGFVGLDIRYATSKHKSSPYCTVNAGKMQVPATRKVCMKASDSLFSVSYISGHKPGNGMEPRILHAAQRP